MNRKRGGDEPQVLPAVEIRRGIDRPVVSQAEQLVRVNLEVEMRCTAEGITGVPDEAEYVSSPYVPRVKHARGIAGEMCVIELVGRRVPYPQTPAAHLVPADAVDRSVRDRDHRRAERGEDVVAVVPLAANIASERAVGVSVPREADDGEDVGAFAKRRCDLERLRDSVPMLPSTRTCGSCLPGRSSG